MEIFVSPKSSLLHIQSHEMLPTPSTSTQYVVTAYSPNDLSSYVVTQPFRLTWII